MKRLILSFCIVLLLPSLVFSHPGRTDRDGCHVCRSNCAQWNVEKGVKHCHSGTLEPLSPSQWNNKIPDKENISIYVQIPGWEYGLKIQKTGTLTTANIIEEDIHSLSEEILWLVK